MSYVNVTTLSEDSVEQLGLKRDFDIEKTHGHQSFETDSESLMAAAELISRLDNLQSGEMLIVTAVGF
jgi:hypothetical protein